MRRLFCALAALLIAAPALAQEPVGCDKFKFNLDQERALLNGDDVANVKTGDSAPLSRALSVALVPFASAGLPVAPERPPKSASSFAGFVRFAAVPQPGSYKVTVSDVAWIDVVQDGALQKSSAFSGALGCPGVRKSVIFPLNAAPFTVEISGVTAPSIRLAVTPAP